MKTVKDVSSLTGVSVRTLHYYDSIGLLQPSGMTEAGYRLYDDTALERLQNILIFRELQFSLKEIRQILDSPVFDRNKALEQQIALLKMKREHIENLIVLARGIQMTGVKGMDLTVFNTKEIDEYAKQAKAAWGGSEAYREFEEKSGKWTEEDQDRINREFMGIFVELGRLRGSDPASGEAQELVKGLKAYITAHFYTCTPEILRGLGSMYAGGGALTASIDKAAGAGTALFAAQAIDYYSEKAAEK